MTEMEISQIKGLTSLFKEKSDLAHAIRCTEQAEKRADSQWLKNTCAFRVKMLRMQLARQNQNF